MAHIVGTSGNDRGATVLHGTVDDDLIEGLAGNDQLLGDDGDDVLDGGTGLDNMAGGNGNDTYYVDNVGDIVTELHGGGRDTVYSTVTYTLSSDVEKLLLTGTANISGFGNADNNTVVGNDGNNKILGGDGDDTLGGGAGNDTLDGGKGADGMKGGAGNDRYYIDNPGDLVTEYSNAGDDTVLINGTYTLTNNVENLIITGSSNRFGTGNALDNHITGSAGDNTLGGADGNDVIDGGKGADLMRGGLGNDTFYVDNTGDVVAEYTNAGTDSVFSSVTFTLGNNVENLTLTGTGNHNATGNGLDNILTGNAGNNVMNGKAGADTMIGGAGNDTYYVDNSGDIVTEGKSGGSDEVRSSIDYALGANLENLTLLGAANLHATGNTLNNTLTGNTGDNSLDGAGGTDTLAGGIGNDTYYVTAAANGDLDLVVEGAGAGSDTVFVMSNGIAYTLTDNVENLVLARGGTGTGNAHDNTITVGRSAGILYGMDGNDTLTGNSEVLGSQLHGGAGDDILTTGSLLDGGQGDDIMNGGQGSTTYFVDSSGDVVLDSGTTGTDTVMSSITYHLADALENLYLTGSGNVDATGNAKDNSLGGNAGDNILDGGLGRDTADYTATTGGITVNLATGTASGVHIGNDTLVGIEVVRAGAGNNVLTGSDGADTLYGGASGSNIIDGGAGADYMEVSGGDNTFYVDNAGDVAGDTTRGDGVDLVISLISYKLSGILDNLTLTGTANLSATGNGFDNIVTGNSGDNLISTDGADDIAYGMAGNDEIHGGIGNDHLYGGDGNDTLFGEAGYLYNHTGDYLDGGAGADIMNGSVYTDTYIVDDTGDVVNDTYNGDMDVVRATVSYTLSVNLENIVLDGTAAINATGNAQNNQLTGNAADNVLDGGDGNDWALYDGASAVTANLHTGTATGAASGTDTLVHIENIMGGAGDDILTGDDAVNILNGGAGNNTIDGGSGADIMIGGTGNDTFYVDNAGDAVTDGGGNDLVLSSVSYTLAEALQTSLTLTGTADLSATGNAFKNTIVGNDGDNRLDGAGGVDTLTGGLGADEFYFNTAQVGLAEHVTDFSTSDGDILHIVAYDPSEHGGSGPVVFQSGADVIVQIDSGHYIVVANTTYNDDFLSHLVVTLAA